MSWQNQVVMGWRLLNWNCSRIENVLGCNASCSFEMAYFECAKATQRSGLIVQQETLLSQANTHLPLLWVELGGAFPAGLAGT